MNTENNPSQPEAQKQVENETLKNEGTQTTEGEGSGKTPVNGEKQEESTYARELREAREDAAKSKEIAEKKEATIQALKRDKKNAPAADPEELEERILTRVRAENTEREFNQRVAILTRDPDEQALITHHYNTTIVRTGDVDRDLQNAMALANAAVVLDQKRNQAIEERREEFLTSFPANNARGNTPMKTVDPMQRQVEDLVRKMNPDAVKHVPSQFAK